MTDPTRDLGARLALVRRAIERSAEPLDVPVGLVFRPLSGREHLETWSEHVAGVADGTAYAPATLYVHVPFCARVCTYCLLSASQVPGKSQVAAYLDALRAQIALYAPAAAGLRFGSIHVGGGTPTLLDERQLDALFTDLARLPREETAQIGVEAHPGTATAGRLHVLREHGVHRLSFGIESLTPAVLRNVNREDQTDARVRASIAEARRLGFAINIDLLAGLPGETEASWEDTVRRTLELEPDSMSVNRFLAENSELARLGYGPDEDENRRADRMLLAADAIVRATAPRWPEEPLARPGFGSQYVWDRSNAARRYFQDDMIGPVSTLALGHGALGHVYGRHFSIAAGSIDDWVRALARGEPPAMLAARVDERFEKAFFVADQACRGALSLASYRRVFRSELAADFRAELDALLARGLLAVRGDRIAKPPHPRFQVMDLLAFLARDTDALAREVRALEASEPAPADDAAPGWTALGADADLEALVREQVAAGVRALRLDVGEALAADAATRLAAIARREGLRVEVRAAGDRELAQYADVREELPPSMLWVRISIRASQASRGEQRLARRRAG